MGYPWNGSTGNELPVPDMLASSPLYSACSTPAEPISPSGTTSPSSCFTLSGDAWTPPPISAKVRPNLTDQSLLSADERKSQNQKMQMPQNQLSRSEAMRRYHQGTLSGRELDRVILYTARSEMSSKALPITIVATALALLILWWAVGANRNHQVGRTEPTIASYQAGY